MQSIITITNDKTQADMTRLLAAETGNRFLAGQRLMAFFRKCMGGFAMAKVKVGINAAKASGTYTLNTVIATDAVAINGVTFSCVSSGATGNQFNVGGDDDATAVNLAAAINASSDMTDIVTAEASGAVVTVTAASAGTLGNAVTITSADATITASGARLTGGTNGAVERTHFYGSGV